MARDDRDEKKSFFQLIRGFPGIPTEYLVPIGVAIFSGVAVAWIVSNFWEPLRKVLVERQLINVLLFLLVVNTLFYLDGVARQLRAGGLGGILRISRDQKSDNQAFRDLIDHTKPRRADLIEFTTDTIHEIVDDLVAKKYTIRLLVKHPEGLTKFQKVRLKSRLDDLDRRTLDKHPDMRSKVQIRCYRQPASLRGRKLDDKVINVGWYTPKVGEVQVNGDGNPLVTASFDTPEGRHLGAMFDEAFKDLWGDPGTVDWQEVLNQLRTEETQGETVRGSQ